MYINNRSQGGDVHSSRVRSPPLFMEAEMQMELFSVYAKLVRGHVILFWQNYDGSGYVHISTLGFGNEMFLRRMLAQGTKIYGKFKKIGTF